MLYSDARLSHLTSEIFALKDEPREPMVNHFRIEFTAPLNSFDLLSWKAASRTLFERFPKLRKRFSLQKDSYSWDETNRSEEELLDRCWQFQEMSLHEFQNTAILTDQAPLLHLRFHPKEGLCLCIHHAVADGSAILGILAFLIRNLGLQKLSTAVDFKIPIAEYIGGPTSVGQIGLSAITEFLKRIWLSLIAPPIYLGPKEKRFGKGKHRHIQISIPLKTLLEKLKSRSNLPSKLKMNDYILTAYHRALSRIYEENARSYNSLLSRVSSRIGILVSMDLRRWQPAPEEICNWSSNVSCHTFAWERATTFAKMAIQVEKKMTKKKAREAAFFMFQTLEWADRLGLFIKGRRHRLHFGTPSRLKNGKVKFGGMKYLDSAILSNMGKLPVDFPYPESIDKVYAVAPVLSPTSVALGVTTTQKYMNLYLRASDTHFDEAKASKLMHYLVDELSNRNLAD